MWENMSTEARLVFFAVIIVLALIVLLVCSVLKCGPGGCI